MKKIKVTQVKSVIDRSERQKRTMVALGLKKMNATVEVEATPQILGMVRKVEHLVKVEEAQKCKIINVKYLILKDALRFTFYI